jgi:hypothetical protein
MKLRMFSYVALAIVVQAYAQTAAGLDLYTFRKSSYTVTAEWSSSP